MNLSSLARKKNLGSKESGFTYDLTPNPLSEV